MNQFDRIFGSLVWSTYGDALSCCSENTKDNLFPQEISLCEWKLPNNGTKVTMPLGAYSADTQLRLATSRTLGAKGAFDVESFSKVELVVWRCYAVRASSGLKAASKSLLKPDVQWNSNFFSDSKNDYFDQRGYEAAARIQPHVLSAMPSMKDSEVLRTVIRNAIVTHGHPEGFISAAFHALCLCHTFRDGKVASLKVLKEIFENLKYLPILIRKDDLLSGIWLSVWENKFGVSLEDAIRNAVQTLGAAIDGLGAINPSSNPLDEFNHLLNLPSFGARYGNGFRTAVLAAGLSILCEGCPEEALKASARCRVHGVSTLVGATLGMVTDQSPLHNVIDLEYITTVARKLCNLREGMLVAPFNYPDLLYWQPPRSELDYIGKSKGTWTLAGLGEMKLLEKTVERQTSQEGAWNWFRLHFGQHILAKRRDEASPLDDCLQPAKIEAQIKSNCKNSGSLDATEAIRLVVQSGLDPSTIGDCLIRLGRQPNGRQQAKNFVEFLAGILGENAEGKIDELPLSLDSLLPRWTSGERFKFTYFYGNNQPSVGVDQSCFSQWFERPFIVEGIVYPTAEHWMMASKAKLFGDSDALERILETRSPKMAKSAGRKVRGFHRDTWDNEKVQIVREGNIAKFSQHSDLRSYLFSTKNTILVEAASKDTVWGIGLSATDSRSKDPTQWQGQNLLGFVLTEVRSILSRR